MRTEDAEQVPNTALKVIEDWAKVCASTLLR